MVAKIVRNEFVGSSILLGSTFNGGLAQSGERLHGMQKVIGSNPLTSTFSPWGHMPWGRLRLAASM